MKYIIVLTDGLADEPIEALGNKTPLEAADLPMLKALAKESLLGMVNTVPDGMSPGSDVANLSVFGYPPNIFHSGRSPLEAASIGIPLAPTDVTLRANLVTLDWEADKPYHQRRILDHASGEITTEASTVLIQFLADAFSKRLKALQMSLHVGVSYRHLLLWQHGHLKNTYVPPHDILGQGISDYLPKGDAIAMALQGLMADSYDLLQDHPINLKRRQEGLNPANSLWFWGEGTKPALRPFKSCYGLSGHVISAVDLIKGIGHLAELRVLEVQGATGNLHTNFRGKAQAALEGLLSGDDFSYVHLEAPDECGHQGDWAGKVESIEKIDQEVIKPLVEGLRAAGEPFRLLVVSDHPTPVRLRTHTRAAVPFLLYDSRESLGPTTIAYDEKSVSEAVAAGRGVFLSQGYQLMALLTQQESPF